MRVINKTRSTTLMQTGAIADNTWTRFKGLMRRKNLPAGEGLIIIPNNSVHCFFMRFPIDVVFVSKDQKVVHISRNLKPWRISKIVGKAHYVIELNGGEASQTEIGDVVEWRDEKTNAPVNPLKYK
jgi:uncharacterized protein